MINASFVAGIVCKTCVTAVQLNLTVITADRKKHQNIRVMNCFKTGPRITNFSVRKKYI